MKRRWKRIGLGLLIFSPGLLYGQYQIEWSAFGGGGGYSTGGVYAVTGTIGQDAGDSANGGAYGLVSGFWGVLGTVPTPGAPRLSIEQIGNGVRVSWSVTATNFVLQQTTTLTGAPSIPWAAGAFAYETNGGRISVTLPMPTGKRFFRLRQP